MRTRLVLASLLAVAVTAGGVAMERVLGVRRVPAPGRAPEEISGAWFCPHGGGPDWTAWVVAANPSPNPADLVVTTFAGRRPRVVRERLEPGTQRYVEVPAPTMASGTMVEFFGAPVAAGMGVARPDGGGAAAEPCAAGAGRRWYAPDGTSVEGQQTHLVVMNPFATDAAFDVELTSEKGVVRPGVLQGVVLRSRRTVSFDLNRFVLGADTLAATVMVRLGKAVAASVGVAEAAVRQSLAAPRPSTLWLLPGAGDGGESDLVVMAVRARAPFEVRAQGVDRQVTVLEDQEARPARARSFEVATQEAGLAVQAEGRAGFVTARRTTLGGAGEQRNRRRTSRRQDRRKGQERQEEEAVDQAGTTGVAAASDRWTALPAVGPEGGASALVLDNPGGVDAPVQLRLIGASGPLEGPEAESVTVPAGRTVRVNLTEVTGGDPVTALIDAEAGAIVAAQVALSPDAYAVSVGIPRVPR